LTDAENSTFFTPIVDSKKTHSTDTHIRHDAGTGYITLKHKKSIKNYCRFK